MTKLTNAYCPVVYIAINDSRTSEEVASQVTCFGYQAHLFTTDHAFIESVQMRRPDFIVIDTDFASGGAIEMIKALQQRLTTPIPIIFMGVDDNLQTRLECVRAEGKAFLSAPLEISNLLEVLDNLSVSHEQDAHRILIMEDSKAQAYFIAKTLSDAGMETEVVNDPLTLLKTLADFRPDLILMDVYLPTCTGLELANVIRQQESYVSVPIVFLSAEQDLSQQMQAMMLGGDDFLTKPITPEHLVSAIASRVERSRVLRSYMIRDSLTGLLNHTHTLERLEVEVSRSYRALLPLSFVMLDLDHFKQINDNYGHAVGDRVIKSLAQLMQQRLRKADTIGRYGGEEFAVILPNTDLEQAVNLVNEIREAFASLRQFAVDGTFYTTFSAGVAQLQGDNGWELADRADKALYQAKKLGRNEVVGDDMAIALVNAKEY